MSEVQKTVKGAIGIADGAASEVAPKTEAPATTKDIEIANMKSTNSILKWMFAMGLTFVGVICSITVIGFIVINNAIQQQQVTQKQQYENLMQNQENLKFYIDNRITESDNKFDVGMGQLKNEFYLRMGMLENGMTSLESRMVVLESEFDVGMGALGNEFDVRMGALENDMGLLKNDMGLLKNGMGLLDNEFDIRMVALEDEMGQLNNRMGMLENEMAALQPQQSTTAAIHSDADEIPTIETRTATPEPIQSSAKEATPSEAEEIPTIETKAATPVPNQSSAEETIDSVAGEVPTIETEAATPVPNQSPAAAMRAAAAP